MSIPEIEKQILEFWKKDKTFEKSLNKKGKDYIFYDGPPFATGLPHYGHILASTIKDIVPRFWTMNGRYVKRVWGWDCHGLPIENIAEKELGIKTKDEIEKMGVKKFNAFCRSRVFMYTREWGSIVERIGRWVDFENSYKTMDNSYIESVWWAFKQLYDKGFIYKGEKVLMYCPRCGTPIASSEIAMDKSYRTIEEDTITVRFKLKDEDAYVLAWTTTPWTLPSNLALIVNPDLTYVYLQNLKDNKIYILGQTVVTKYFENENEYKIIREVIGSDLIKKRYEPIFPYFSNLKKSFRIIAGDFVTADDGTGIVHAAPAFGEIDYLVCKENGIDFVQPIDKQGKFTNEVVDFAGMYIKDADVKIIEFLKQHGKIVKIERKAHEYPFCYRCETPLMYRAIPSWFVNIQKIKQKMLKLNEKINWYPGSLKNGRFKNNIETAPDWTISRNRYWASAMPVWQCDECGKFKVIGSIDELKQNAINLSGDIDLHKDYLDAIKLKCECKKEMTRIPEVLDCWFESGSMPFAQFHYPFENKKYFEENFPAEFVAEYIAQTRAWFYYCLVMSTILFDDIPYKNIVVTGTILAENGEKMSKSKNNFPNPIKLFEKYGVDALRLYLITSPVMKADDLCFSEKGVDEVVKKVSLMILNILSFYKLFATGIEESVKSKNILDKWILSKTESLKKEITEGYENYDLNKAAKPIAGFIDELSTWYVRRSRERFKSDEKEEAEQTLKYVLLEFSKIIAPIMPFIADYLYQELSNSTSVHLADWPEVNKKLIDEKLEEQMEQTRNICSLGLQKRAEAGIKVRQPLGKLQITNYKLQDELIDLIKDEVNVKEVVADLKEGVVLDTTITEELKAEGLVRDFVRSIQSKRKEMGLTPKDKIRITVGLSSEALAKEGKIIERYAEQIKKQVIAEEIVFDENQKSLLIINSD
jgi:isoleucyl-tRNA synthetase